MPTTDSRLGPGTLKLGRGADCRVRAQAANVELTPTVNSNDGTPTLATPSRRPRRRSRGA